MEIKRKVRPFLLKNILSFGVSVFPQGKASKALQFHVNEDLDKKILFGKVKFMASAQKHPKCLYNEYEFLKIEFSSIIKNIYLFKI